MVHRVSLPTETRLGSSAPPTLPGVIDVRRFEHSRQVSGSRYWRCGLCEPWCRGQPGISRLRTRDRHLDTSYSRLENYECCDESRVTHPLFQFQIRPRECVFEKAAFSLWSISVSWEEVDTLGDREGPQYRISRGACHRASEDCLTGPWFTTWSLLPQRP